MRRIPLLVAGLLIALPRVVPVTQFAPDPPGPIVKGPTGKVAAGDTIVYTISWGPGARATSYDIVRSATATNGAWQVAADSSSTGKSLCSPAGSCPLPFTGNIAAMTFKTWLTAIPWDSATFTITVTSRNAFGVSAPVSATWRVLRKPGAPGPVTVDSSKAIGTLVFPTAATVLVTRTRTLCAFKQFGNGAVAEWTDAKPACDSIYITYVPLAARLLVTPAQQAHTDSLTLTCVSWSGGSPYVALTPLAPCSAAVTATGLLATGLRAPADATRAVRRA